MKQKIIIKNFGPIKDVEMEIDDFTIFIGPQTSGKSTIAKSVFFFLSLRDDMMIHLQKDFDNYILKNELDGFREVIKTKFYEYWGGANTGSNGNFELKYFYSEKIWIQLIYKRPSEELVTFNFSKDFISQILTISHTLKMSSSMVRTFSTSKDLAQKTLEKGRVLMELNNRLNEIFGFDGDLLFIPAGRSILSTLSEQIQNLNPRSLDPLMKTFIDRINASKGFRGSDDLQQYHFYEHLKIEEKAIDLLKTLSESILKGSYFYDEFEDGGDKIKISHTDYIKLLFASSGQQEAVWIIQMILLLILNKQKVFIVIEEPEAHLFPEAQKNIINLITLLANVNDNQVFITTHSPYLLTSLNNLVYAYQVGQKHPEKVSEIVNKQLWLNPDKLQAYFVGGKDNQGKIRSIIDPNLRIIQTEEIDSASSINNHEFDQLFDLE